jgi:hypothetical protein
MTTHDAARQLGKAYVGALNTGPQEFAARFAPGARLTVSGAPATLDDVLRVTPPGRSGFRGARVEPEEVVWTVRVRSRTDVDDQEHRVRLDAEGLVTDLRA